MTTQIENQKHKDTVYRMLYQDKTRLLELYNGLNGSNYTNVEDLTVTTLEGETFLKMKNDVSFVFNDELSLYEHQSTACPNIPLRDLFYVASLYRDMIDINDTYLAKRMKIPAPRFVVFYNGTTPMEDQRVYKLSDMFEHEVNPPEMELVVRVININEGHNKALMDSCKSLKQYSIFVGKVRKYIERVKNEYSETNSMVENIIGIDSENRKKIISEAVNIAIDECIDEDILKDFFEQYRKEVIEVSVIEYSAERHINAVRNEAYDSGLEQGITGTVAILHKLGYDDEAIVDNICGQYGLTEEQARKYL